MPKGRQPVVVDSNVPITANRRAGGSYTCASNCASALLAIKERGFLLVDDKNLIADEYRRHLNYKGQPGAGDAFVRWFFNNRGKSDLCGVVPITHSEHNWKLFNEFPDDETLSAFDPADQKFIATAVASLLNPKIMQATDHKWLAWSERLAAHGINIQFVCLQELQETFARKRSPKRTSGN